MPFQLPKLPYALDALEPHMSRETLEYHYGKHHRAYVEKANKLLSGSELERKPVETIIRKSSGAMFENVAQMWNHTFFWNGLTPDPEAPGRKVQDALGEAFGSIDRFREKFSAAAAALFGSGWTWLAQDADGNLKITTMQNAGNPLTGGEVPLLACDVWEHAYYIDYRNARPEYLEHFWKLVNWKFVEENMAKADNWLASLAKAEAAT